MPAAIAASTAPIAARMTIASSLISVGRKPVVQFHQLFFEGDSFAFRYDDTLIRLYPEQLWNDAAILIGVLTGVLSVALLGVSWWWLKKMERAA